MPEPDVFEARLHHAVHAYVGGVSSDLDPVAFAARVAREHPRHRLPGVAGALALRRPWRGSIDRRAAWVLVAAAALLALAGALAAAGAFRRDESRLVLPPVHVADGRCIAGAAPDDPGPAGQARPPVGWFTPAFDRASGRIVALVQPRTAAVQELWTFDVCTNTWSRARAGVPPELAAMSVDLAYDATADRVLAVGEQGETWTYDTDADAWATGGQAPSPLDALAGTTDHGSGDLAVKRLAYDDGLGAVVMVAPLEHPRTWTYSVAERAWTERPRPAAGAVAGASAEPRYSVVTYDPALDRLVLLDGANGFATRLLDPRTGAWTDVDAGSSPWRTGFWGRVDTASAFDRAAGLLVTTNDGLTATLAPARGAWQALPTTPHNWTGHVLVEDTVNGRLVLLGGSYRTATAEARDSDGVWALDAASGTWTVLLAPSDDGSPAGVATPAPSRSGPAGDAPAPVPDAACPAGSDPDAAGSATTARPEALELFLADDRGSAKVVGIAVDDDFAGWTPWVLDVCTNTWSRALAAPAASAARAVAYDAAADRVVVFGSGGTVLRYDVDADRWSTGTPWPGDEREVNATAGITTSLAVFDRALGRVVVLVGRTNPQVWTYDTAADAWLHVPSSGEDPTAELVTSIPAGYSEAAYDPVLDRVVVVAAEQPGGHAMSVDPRTGRWERLPWTMGEAGVGWGDTGAQMVFDEATGRTILVSGGYVNAYDGATGRWTMLASGVDVADGPLHRFLHGVAYDAANRRLVVAGGEYVEGGAERRADDTWALDAATMTWTRLVAPTTILQSTGGSGGWAPVPTPGG